MLNSGVQVCLDSGLWDEDISKLATPVSDPESQKWRVQKRSGTTWCVWGKIWTCSPNFKVVAYVSAEIWRVGVSMFPGWWRHPTDMSNGTIMQLCVIELLSRAMFLAHFTSNLVRNMHMPLTIVCPTHRSIECRLVPQSPPYPRLGRFCHWTCRRRDDVIISRKRTNSNALYLSRYVCHQVEIWWACSYFVSHTPHESYFAYASLICEIQVQKLRCQFRRYSPPEAHLHSTSCSTCCTDTITMKLVLEWLNPAQTWYAST